MINSKKIKSKIETISAIITSLIFFLLTTLGICYHDYWSYIIYEKSPMGYYEALLLFFCFLIALLNFIVSHRYEEKWNLSWIILTLGFLYLTLDEKFAIHETIREEYFKPNNLTLEFLFWVEKGDYVLMFVFLVGLCAMPILYKEIKKYRKSMILFLLALIFTAGAVFTDSIDLKGIDFSLQKFIQYMEEVFETTGMLLFLNSFVGILIEKRKEYAKKNTLKPFS